jgi:hypothetical protein
VSNGGCMSEMPAAELGAGLHRGVGEAFRGQGL